VPLDPHAQAIVDLLSSVFPDVGGRVTDAAEARRMLKEQALVREPAAIARIENRSMGGSDGNELPIRIYWPASPPPTLPVIVFFHGGGWVLCDLDTHDAICRSLANGVHAIVVSVDYRLAPEHRYPAAFNDAYASVEWVRAHASELGGDPDRLAIAGDSAGGNLAACVAVALRDRNGPPIRAQLLVYPVIDAGFDTPSYRDNAEGYFLTAQHMHWYWDQYVPDATARHDPYVAPMHTRDLTGVAPAHIVTAEFDPLRDEGEAYGARLRAAGVPTEVHRYDGMFHGFFGMGEVLPGAQQAVHDACTALRNALHS